MPGKFLLNLIGFFLLILLASCSHSQQMTWEQLSQHPATQKMSLLTLDCPPFQLIATVPQQHETKTLRIYIEGDGLAWRTRHYLSSDPTPIKPVALQLMQEDPSIDKAYLARPCQYKHNDNCDNRYWSSHRFSKIVIDSMDTAVTQLKNSGGYQKIELVGFSGGGAIATLISAQRNDVDLLITLAGNLDHQAFTKWHHVTPLTGSLNPADFSQKLTQIKQIHFIGSKDRTVPPSIFDSYVKRYEKKKNIKKVILDISHSGEWGKKWKKFLSCPSVKLPKKETSQK